MIDVLGKRIIRLVRDDDGVALVVTLALFMFMYVSCAGVFAIGQSVKDRIILQNAVDAAAYSAAVVQADTLSRIATINRAMAWTYKSLVCSQMDWIAIKTLAASHEEYLKNQEQADAIGADLTPPNQYTMGIRAGSDERTPVETTVEGYLKSAPDSLANLEVRIDECAKRLVKMNTAVAELKDGMNAKIAKAAADVLEANLPARLGDLCRWHVSTIPVDKCLVEMDSSMEKDFVGFADEVTDDFADQDWFALSGGTSFSRSFLGALKTFWKWRHKATHVVSSEGFDAESFKSEFEEAYKGHLAVPLVVAKEYFPSEFSNDAPEFSPSKGAITVAVAKLNENPWYGVTDGRGLYEAFAYPDAAEWTVVLSSAQAGYRDFGAGRGLDYSLIWDDSRQGWNLRTDDWNAVFVPVRKAFARGSDDDSLDHWMKSGSWNRVASSPKYKDSLKEFEFSELNHSALPRMHNSNGAENALSWSDDDFLDLFYH